VLLFVCALLFVVATTTFGFWYTGVPYIKSGLDGLEEVFNKYGMNREHLVLELGSGDGTVAFFIEKTTGAYVRGYELVTWAYAVSRIRQKLKRSSARFFMKNFMSADFSDADFIYCFIYPPAVTGLQNKILQEMKPGSIVISRDFPLERLQEVDFVALSKPHCLFVYRV
jgi:SAM-dependent methyltransferase